MNEEPAGRPFAEAFDITRSITHGYRSLLRCMPVLFVGGCLKACSEGGGGNYSSPMQNSDPRTQEFLHNLFRGSWMPEIGATGPWITSPLDGPLGFFMEEVDTFGMAVVIGVVAAVVLVVVTVLLAFRAWFIPGYIRLHQQVIETGSGDWATLFSGADRFWAMVGWQLLSGAVVLGTLVVACIPSVGTWIALGDSNLAPAVGISLMLVIAVPVVIYVGLGVSLGAHVVTLDVAAPLDAFERSWSLVSGNRISWFIYGFATRMVQLFITLSGLCLCCVGIVFTRPCGNVIYDLGVTKSYLLHTRQRSETDAWSIHTWGG